jgi:hypothetical protein
MDTFGSNATAMGGAAGRSDAMIGAVEAPKAEGVLHAHLFLYVQMITQFGTLHELAEALQKKLLEAETVKRYVSYVRCAAYPDVEAFRANKSHIEKEWPAFLSEQSLCRLPRFFGSRKTLLVRSGIRSTRPGCNMPCPGETITSIHLSTHWMTRRLVTDVYFNLAVQKEANAV